MRTPASRLPRFAPAALSASLLIALAGCSGGSTGTTVPNTFGLCDQNAQSISIARPTPGFPSNGNAIEIVSSTSNDQLHATPGGFDLNLVDQFNNEIDTDFLGPVSDQPGPHPYTNDFYYAASPKSSLLSGRTYNVYLNAPSTSCQRGLVGQIFT